MGCAWSSSVEEDFSELSDDNQLSPSKPLVHHSIDLESIPPSNLPKYNEDETLQFKVILLGDAAVGKSSLIQRFESNTFNHESSKTVGIEFSTCFIELDNNRNLSSPSKQPRTHTPSSGKKKKIQLQLWDAAGELNYTDIRKVYYQGCHAVILVYVRFVVGLCENVCDEESFSHMKNEWLNEVNAYLHKSVHITKAKKERQHVVFSVWANQIDIDSKRKIDYQSGQEFAQSIDAKYFETSARTGQNVVVSFTELAKELDAYFCRYMPPQ